VSTPLHPLRLGLGPHPLMEVKYGGETIGTPASPLLQEQGAD
jgi:hypothetical protein